MTIKGLSNNNYLINNEIYISVDDFASTIKWLEVKVTNNYNSVTQKIRVYPINNKVEFIDISSLVKSTFSTGLSVLDTINEIKIDLKTDADEIENITKFFIMGGNFKGNYINGQIRKNYLPENVPLLSLITETTPSNFVGIGDRKIVNGKFVKIPQDKPDICGVSVRFLNQFGYYFMMTFENYEEFTKTKIKSKKYIKKPSLSFSTAESFEDLGVGVESGIVLKGVTPEKYNEIMLHLLLSNDVYVQIGKRGIVKVKQTNNKYIHNKKDKSFNYNITFQYENVLNPSLLC